MSNIKYKSRGFSEYYSIHRHTWEDFYESERVILGRVIKGFKRPVTILDVGCGCGGLGEALSNEFVLSYYKGIDINAHNIEYAKKHVARVIKCNNEFAMEDVALFSETKKYDIVISLSCVDFNVEVEKMIRNCWEMVAEDGYFVLSVRLTNQKGVNDIKKSFQKISKDENDSEVANYVVFNYIELFRLLSSLEDANSIMSYGYWGKPSSTASTPYEKLCFSVIAVKKCNQSRSVLNMEMPIDLII